MIVYLAHPYSHGGLWSAERREANARLCAIAAQRLALLGHTVVCPLLI